MAVDAETVRGHIEEAIQTAVNNAGFTQQIITAVQPFAPNVYLIRLNVIASSHALGGVSTRITPTLYNNNSEAQQVVDNIAQKIENYLNKYDELYPQINIINYNNFQFLIDIKVV